MSELRIVVVEDNPHEFEMMEDMLSRTKLPINYLGAAHTVAEAVALIRELKPDLVLMDIELPDGNGFDVLDGTKDLEHSATFITAHDQYVIQALRYAAFDYLLKPLAFEELERTIKLNIEQHQGSVNQRLEVHSHNQNEHAEKRLGVRGPHGLYLIEVSDILYIKAEGSYSAVHLRDGKIHTCSKLLKEYEFLCESDSFLRTHKSYLVNMRNVQEFSKKDRGILTLVSGQEVPAARNRRDEVVAAMGKWCI